MIKFEQCTIHQTEMIKFIKWKKVCESGLNTDSVQFLSRRIFKYFVIFSIFLVFANSSLEINIRAIAIRLIIEKTRLIKITHETVESHSHI